MRISIQGAFILVQIESRVMAFDCTKDMYTTSHEIGNCVTNKLFDKYDAQMITKFVLQHRRTLSLGGK